MNTVVITGVGQGIGKALAQKFLAGGWRVVGTTTTGQADYTDSNLSIIQLDLRDVESIKHCANKIKESGSIDVLINNAGVLLDEEETELKVDFLRGNLEVNLIGLVDLTEQLLPAIKDGGKIINISSTAGSLTLASEGKSHYPHHYPAYKISKAALNMYTVTLADRLRGRMVVASIHPGWVKTAMGGEEATITSEEAADNIFTTITNLKETGRFWFNQNQLPW